MIPTTKMKINSDKNQNQENQWNILIQIYIYENKEEIAKFLKGKEEDSKKIILLHNVDSLSSNHLEIQEDVANYNDQRGERDLFTIWKTIVNKIQHPIHRNRISIIFAKKKKMEIK